MINNDKWINSIPNNKSKLNNELTKIDHDKWVNTIPKKNNYNSVKKYSLILTMFVFGFILVSVVKNQTRYLEKEINFLQASINSIKFNLNQATLDNQVITSPENISKLAKEYLNNDFVHYKKSQIKNLNNYNEILEKKEKNEKKEIIRSLSKSVKTEVAKKIEKKKQEIAKLKELYNDPKSIPDEVRNKVSKKIKQKRSEIEDLSESPKDVLTLQRVGKWGAVQVVKAFFGMPVIPGR